MRRWLPLPLLLLTAQAAPPIAAPPPAAVDPGEELAFDYHDERMTVPVAIAGAGPYRFVIDTGAQRTVISRELARRLGLADGPSIGLTAMSGSSRVGTAVIPSIKVSSLGGERIEAPLLEGRFLGAPGMLGLDTLQGHAVAIDFDRRSMALQPSRKRMRQNRSTPGEVVVRARNLYGQLVVTDAYVGGVKVRVILDTGTAVTTGNLALRRKLRRVTGVPIELVSVVGGVLQADYTTVPAVRIGDARISNMPVAFADAAPFRAFMLEDRPALMLGMDALKLFRRVRIDFPNREVRFTMPEGTRIG
jgi:predicted aspartyl protease